MQYKIRGTKVTSPYPVKLTPAEMRLVFMLQKYFASERIFVDYFLPKKDKGLFADKVVTEADLLQIDCLAVNQRGIFVFESKDYIGWIYGHGDREYWTQVSAYGKNKHRFYNPVKQNQAHIEALRALCGGQVPIYSVIVFGRETTLKVLEDIPEDCLVCMQAELYSALDSLSSVEILAEDEVRKICQKLKCGRVSPSARVRAEHVTEIETIVKARESKI